MKGSVFIPPEVEAARRWAYGLGLTDAEIAARTGAKSRQVIYEWRKRRGLLAHRTRGNRTKPKPQGFNVWPAIEGK